MNTFMNHSIVSKSRKHLDRLKLGTLFPTYEACWTPTECAKLVDLIGSQCIILDRLTPDYIDYICSLRRCSAGLSPLTGQFREAQFSLQAINGNFGSSFSSIIDGPRDASLEGADYCLMGTGCALFHEMFSSLLEASTVVLPKTLQKIMTMDPRDISPQYVSSILEADGIGCANHHVKASGA